MTIGNFEATITCSGWNKYNEMPQTTTLTQTYNNMTRARVEEGIKGNIPWLAFQLDLREEGARVKSYTITELENPTQSS